MLQSIRGDEEGWSNCADRGEVGRLNEALNVIVMEKLFNLPLMPPRGTYVKLIAYKKFIPSSWKEQAPLRGAYEIAR